MTNLELGSYIVRKIVVYFVHKLYNRDVHDNFRGASKNNIDVNSLLLWSRVLTAHM
jgi:hypothetical protein